MDNLSSERLRPLSCDVVRGDIRMVLDYWQSLRVGGSLPSRTDFCPSRIRRALSKLMIVQVWPGERVVCRLAGTKIVRVVGQDLTGCDIIANTPREFQRERLSRYMNSLDGFAHRSERTMPGASGEAIRAECLILPFADFREDGSRPALLAADWSSVEDDDKLKSAASAFVVPEISEYLAI